MAHEIAETRSHSCSYSYSRSSSSSSSFLSVFSGGTSETPVLCLLRSFPPRPSRPPRYPTDDDHDHDHDHDHEDEDDHEDDDEHDHVHEDEWTSTGTSMIVRGRLDRHNPWVFRRRSSNEATGNRP
jgi:hypothetical protein